MEVRDLREQLQFALASANTTHGKHELLSKQSTNQCIIIHVCVCVCGMAYDWLPTGEVGQMLSLKDCCTQ